MDGILWTGDRAYILGIKKPLIKGFFKSRVV